VRRTKEGTPEAFLLFSQSIPSQNLGFVDSKATELELTIGSRELLIHQSPTILSSNRGGGTTGAGKYVLRFLYTTDICSCLENYAFVRIMDYINLEFVIQARYPRFQCKCSGVGMWDIWGNWTCAQSTNWIICLDRPRLCDEGRKFLSLFAPFQFVRGYLHTNSLSGTGFNIPLSFIHPQSVIFHLCPKCEV
jgi:hypothetical protein